MTKVKICGISRVEHAIAAADAGADFIGIIFAESKRQVTPEKAKELVGEVKLQRPSLGQKPRVVGVFVNTPSKEVNEIAEYCGLDWVQLHGDESLEECSAIDTPILKVIRIDAQKLAEELVPGLETQVGAIYRQGYVPMLDNVSTGRYYGGTGRPVDWNVAGRLAGEYQIMLSGGLKVDNVAQAIEQARPWGVDVSSGVETDGVKDPDKIRAFIGTVKEVDARLESAVEG
ncbi:MAG: phosphoribosylanthranilate isomerase [Dehalococcoidia bacterium]